MQDQDISTLKRKISKESGWFSTGTAVCSREARTAWIESLCLMSRISIVDIFKLSYDSEASLNVLKQAIKDYEKPEIINSDQGSQFTCENWVEYLKGKGIKISMDGKGRAIDNIFIERFWRTLKYDYVYLHPAEDGLELYNGVKGYIRYYNHSLHHQGIGRKIPADLYRSVA